MNIFVFLMLVGILSSLLLTTTVTNINNNLVLGQEEEEDEEKENEEEQKDQEDEEQPEEDGDKDSKDSEESSNDEVIEVQPPEQNNTTEETQEEPANESIIAEPLQQISDGWLDISKTKQELEQQKQQVLTEEQEFKEQLKSILIDINLDDPVTTTTPPQTTTSELSCNCTPIGEEEEQKQPTLISTNPILEQPTETTTSGELQQIIIKPSDIVNSKSIGSIKNADYTGNFSAPNVLDNIVGGNNSYWSQYGKSGFLIQLKGNALKDWEVCSAEVNTYQPKNVPFTLAVQAGKNYTGILDNTIENVDFGECVKNVNKIMMYFDSVDKYTSISELKLFGKLVNDNTPPIEPEDPAKIIQIKNSRAEVSIDNSTVILKFGSNTYKIDPDSKIVLIPNKEVNN